jgi:1A family penicillin-binding protein
MRARFGRWVGRLGAWGRRSRAHATVLWIGVALGAGVVLSVVSFGTAYALLDFPREPVQVQSTMVLDADGKEVGALCKDQNRVVVPLDKVSRAMRDAVVAAEDRNFYEHGGIDPVGTLRALLNDVRGGALQGGSTITQQVVKNVRLTSERSVLRKGKEAVLAVKVENQMSKREILALYLNTVYFGRGAYGIEMAARRYFGVSASELDVPKAAYLAGLIRAPELADPVAHPQEATNRRALVLDAMVRAEVIDRAEADAVKAQPIGAITAPPPACKLSGGYAFFIDRVRAWAEQRYGAGVAFSGGLQIRTTLRLPMQQAAEKAVHDTLGRPEDPDAALVAMADDGAVVAMVGGKDFVQSKINLAVGTEGGNLGRQPGSAFKPLVLASAFEHGMPVNQRYVGGPKMKVPFTGFPDYEVSNFDDESFGSIDLYEATAHSVNTVYAQLLAEVGIDNAAETAAKLGIEVPKNQQVPAMTLGVNSTNPLAMLRAYMTFADRGEQPEPYYVVSVTDADGNTLYRAKPERRSVYPKPQADLVNRVLQDVVTKGTGRAAAVSRHQVAGKTGTTEDHADAWFVGYTPRIGAAVWMGFKEGTEKKMDRVHGVQVTGGSLPAQIWGRFMRAAIAGIDTGRFVTPPKELLDAPPKSSSAPPPETTSTTGPGSTTTTTAVTSQGDATTTTTSAPSSSTTSSTTTTAPPRPTTTPPPAITSTTGKPKDNGSG